MSDGCTGFWLLELPFPQITACCAAHDYGASHGVLLDCLLAVLPGWTHGAAALCVAIMILFNPLYRWLKRAWAQLRRGPDGNP